MSANYEAASYGKVFSVVASVDIKDILTGNGVGYLY
jgi:hypothetical protein